MHLLFIHLRLNKFINVTTIKIITNSTYDTMIQKKFNNKTKCVNSLKKLEIKFEKITNIKIQHMKKIVIFATSS